MTNSADNRNYRHPRAISPNERKRRNSYNAHMPTCRTPTAGPSKAGSTPWICATAKRKGIPSASPG
ncbi:MAG: hypothetical protein MZV64_24345 [Ignavibacteriales bacterium]|nr:hypothetical protein [Ignavibacteriales bacterium]